jgi:hypothetical protein
MDGEKLKTISKFLSFRQAVLAVVLFAAVMVVAFAVGKSADRWATDWAQPLLAANKERAALDAKLVIPGTPNQQLRLTTQLRDVRAWAEHHRRVTAFFYARYYVAITMASLTGLFAAFLLVGISIRGWQSASPYGVTALIVFAGASAFFSAFPAIYQQEENVAKNKALYLGYVTLENEMLTYFATGRVEPKGEPLAPDQYIQRVDATLRDLNNMVVTLDRSAIPDYGAEIKKTLGATGQPEEAAPAAAPKPKK